ncbi:hypothetical protein [Anaerobium acetethylicum]|uniref:Cyclic lactone autoinducer peptide n=1 Tax=Anaerobium acetethylicum TaxID=1619234 RepID=A0A1D3TUP0_9FIRM|nr:hypothetical protein [Anaerobium acetethylicum]SCP97787.1 cyclic lactone autoinducer peptide [Anaerobium acetethylicum]
MKKLDFLRKYAGISFAFLALIVAQVASTQFSLIFFQDEVPEKVKELRKR